MREAVFGVLLGALERHTPDFVRSAEIQILMNLTARAFRTRAAGVWFLPADRALERYAEFTVRCMETLPVRPRELYRRAFRTGRRVRILAGIRKREDAERLVFLLYRNIRIGMAGSFPGEITVSDCYFAKFYTPRQCGIMSAADAGIIAGICGGGSLRFTRRITEGCGSCRAHFYERRERR